MSQRPVFEYVCRKDIHMPVVPKQNFEKPLFETFRCSEEQPQRQFEIDSINSTDSNDPTERIESVPSIQTIRSNRMNRIDWLKQVSPLNQVDWNKSIESDDWIDSSKSVGSIQSSHSIEKMRLHRFLSWEVPRRNQNLEGRSARKRNLPRCWFRNVLTYSHGRISINLLQYVRTDHFGFFLLSGLSHELIPVVGVSTKGIKTWEVRLGIFIVRVCVRVVMCRSDFGRKLLLRELVLETKEVLRIFVGRICECTWLCNKSWTKASSPE